MDRKSILILLVTAALFVTWPALVNKIYPPIPKPASTNVVTLGTNKSLATTISAAGTNRVAVAAGSALGATNAPAGKEENIVVENEWARYHFSSSGGGITLVELKDYRSYVGCKADKAATNPPAALNRKSPVQKFRLKREQDADSVLKEFVDCAPNSAEKCPQLPMWKFVPGAEDEKLPFGHEIPSYQSLEMPLAPVV